MESVTSSATILSSSSLPSPVPIFSTKIKRLIEKVPSIRRLFQDDESDLRSMRTPWSQFSAIDRVLSQDAVMGLVLSAVSVRGSTTNSGDGVEPESGLGTASTLPCSLPCQRMHMAFTCNGCGQRTTHAINPHAYMDGTVFVRCCGCISSFICWVCFICHHLH